jgi:hypothetical protein
MFSVQNTNNIENTMLNWKKHFENESCDLRYLFIVYNNLSW